MDQAMENMPPPKEGAEAPQEDGGGSVEQLVAQVGLGLGKIAEMLPPEKADEFAGILGAYQQFIEGLSGGGAQPAPGAASMEGGPEGKPYSPAGV